MLKTKVNNLKKKTPDLTALIHINQYNTDKQNLEKQIGDVNEELQDTSDLVTATVLNAKISKAQYKIIDDSKYITTQEFNKLTTENLTIRLKQAGFVNENDFNNKLKNFNKKMTFNKIKHSEVPKKTKQSNNKPYIFFLGSIYFTNNDGSQKTFVYQTTLDTVELEKDRGTDYILTWKSNGVYNSNIRYYIQLSHMCCFLLHKTF